MESTKTTTVSSLNQRAESLIKQLGCMLTNHPDRPKREINLRVVSKYDRRVLVDAKVVAFANDLYSKLEGKAKKLRTLEEFKDLEIASCIQHDDINFDVCIYI